jgi:large subunit ribosomal protein L4
MTATAQPTANGVLRGPRKKERPAPAARQVVRRDQSGAELGPVELAPDIFGIEPNLAVLHQVVTAQLAAARAGTQSTLTRAEVRGGGAKPYSQKGTGRARQGSRTAAQFVGGGKAFGPKPRSYRQKTPKKMVRLALRSALSDRAASGRIALVDQFDWELPRTKNAVAALGALGLDGRVLVVLSPDDVVAERSFGNLQTVQTTVPGELCAHDVVRSEWVLFTDETLALASGEEVAEEELLEALVEEIVDELAEEIVEEIVAEAVVEAEAELVADAAAEAEQVAAAGEDPSDGATVEEEDA